MDKDERAWQVLRALGDVPGEYLLDAMDEQGDSRPAESRPAESSPAESSPAASRANRQLKQRGVLLSYRPAMRWAAIAAACLLVVLVVRILPSVGPRPADGGLVAAPGDGAAAPGDGEGVPGDGEGVTGDGEGVTVANPIQEFDNLDDLEATAGFAFQIPPAEAPYDVVSYLLIGGEVAEADYRDETGAGYALRKAASQGGAYVDADSAGSDISGDSTEYAYQGTLRATLGSGNEIVVSVRGEEAGALRVATWTYGGYDYAIVADADAPALTEAAVLEMVGATE